MHLALTKLLQYEETDKNMRMKQIYASASEAHARRFYKGIEAEVAVLSIDCTE
uniref:Uncharacterized protein n=1 Tax=Pseudomonas fluorescens (strain SBW25) TaxID=216595 RepID=A0A0G4E5U1_PSEFS|nr:hypothetical protein PQBR55_0135 [Pseudomonas fluorescens SBW25]